MTAALCSGALWTTISYAELSQEELQTIIQQATVANNTYTQGALGAVYSQKQDYAQAKIWYEKAAAQNNTLAQYKLGFLYMKGFGIPQDYAKANAWYEKAAAQNDADAQFTLGVAYMNGWGVRQDYAQAKEWYGKACDNGNQKGCDNYRRLNQKSY